MIRVLPPEAKEPNDTRPGQAYLDRRGRVLWIQRVLHEVGGALCFVLNATGAMHRGAYVKIRNLGKLVKDAPARPCRLHRTCKNVALLLDPRDEEPFCSTRCWQLSGRDPHVHARGVSVDA